MFQYTCEQCGQPFERPRQRRCARHFCGNACYHLATKDGQELTCVVCGRTFYRNRTRVARGERCCSEACLFAKRAAEGLITKVCPKCGESFTVKRSEAGRFTVCSRACRLADTQYVSCKRCGKVFRAEPDLNRHFCSETCRRPPVVIACDNCGSKFRKLPGDADRRFCCFACYRSFTGESSIERAVRLALDGLGIAYFQEAAVGRFSVDFLLTELRVALEVDGSYWHADPTNDARKDRYLTGYGWRVLRVGEADIRNTAHLDVLLAERLQAISNIEIAALQPALF